MSCLLSSICLQRQLIPHSTLQPLSGLTWSTHQVSEKLSSLQLYALLLEERLNCIHWEAEASWSLWETCLVTSIQDIAARRAGLQQWSRACCKGWRFSFGTELQRNLHRFAVLQGQGRSSEAKPSEEWRESNIQSAAEVHRHSAWQGYVWHFQHGPRKHNDKTGDDMHQSFLHAAPTPLFRLGYLVCLCSIVLCMKKSRPADKFKLRVNKYTQSKEETHPGNIRRPVLQVPWQMKLASPHCSTTAFRHRALHHPGC